MKFKHRLIFTHWHDKKDDFQSQLFYRPFQMYRAFRVKLIKCKNFEYEWYYKQANWVMTDSTKPFSQSQKGMFLLSLPFRQAKPLYVNPAVSYFFLNWRCLLLSLGGPRLYKVEVMPFTYWLFSSYLFWLELGLTDKLYWSYNSVTGGSPLVWSPLVRFPLVRFLLL